MPGESPLVITGSFDDDDDDELVSSSSSSDEETSPGRYMLEQPRAEPYPGMARLRRWAMATILYVVAGAMLAGGLAEVIAAETERQTGWKLSLCRVSHDFGHNDSECIYFGVTVLSPTVATRLCAVPATIAASSSFQDPPACHHLGADAAALTYWRNLREGADVECLVPTVTRAAVSLETCISSSTGGHTVAAIVWRTWIERLVYLTQTPREGIAAIEAITQLRTHTGIGLCVGGALLLALVTAAICCCCPPPASLSPTVRRQRHMAAAKMF
jgi:hypothetical protein